MIEGQKAGKVRSKGVIGARALGTHGVLKPSQRERRPASCRELEVDGDGGGQLVERGGKIIEEWRMGGALACLMGRGLGGTCRRNRSILSPTAAISILEQKGSR
eukprot:3662045-Pleurochrysis_carterae.AAC.1